MPLEEIKRIADRPDFDVLKALEGRRSALQAEGKRIKKLIGTIDRTMEHLRGRLKMSDAQLFRGFSEEEQEKLAEEAAQRWDAKTVQASNARWKQYSAEKKQRILDEGKALYTDVIAAMPAGAASPKVQALIKRWHEHVQYFWSPNDEQLLGLGELYNEDARFHANFEAMKPGLAAYMREAIRVYVENRK